VRVSPITGASRPLQKPQGVSQGNHPSTKESPVKDTKPTQSGGSMDGCGNSMSTKDMVQLVMAMQMLEKINEISSKIIEKYIT